RGIVMADQRTLQCSALLAGAVALCTGGNGAVYGQTTNSVICTGSAASRAYQQGVWYANGEFIQIHPTAIPGRDKCRLLSESMRGNGAGVREIDEKVVGESPYHNPMRIFPAMHYTMGGIYCGYGIATDRAADLPADWAQYKHMTNVRGLFVGGEADCQYHGA